MRNLILICLSLVMACSENNMVSTEEDNRQPFVINPANYSERHYFVDYVYRDTTYNIFNNYYGKETSIFNNYYKIKKIQLWKTVTGNFNAQKERRVSLISDLRTRKSSESYSNSYRYNELRGYPLIEGEDYIVNKYTGIVSLINPIGYWIHLGVAYSIEGESQLVDDDIIYGEFIEDTDTTIILKQIKDMYLAPFKSTWPLQLKNVYHVGAKDISEKEFSFDIYFTDKMNTPANSFHGTRLLKAFGLDLNGDGNFDFIPGKTIIPETGDIIFPSLEPFGNDIPEIFAFTEEDSLESPYKIETIYKNFPHEVATDTNASKYYFYGRFFTK